jgi:hypothetical protein
VKSILILIVILLFVGTLSAKDKKYVPRNSDEMEALIAAVSSEYKTNGWSRSDGVCLSVGQLELSKPVLQELRGKNMKIRAQGEWRNPLACDYTINIGSMTINETSGQIELESADLRDIKTGTSDLATLLRRGEYRVQKAGGTWSVQQFIPAGK